MPNETIHDDERARSEALASLDDTSEFPPMGGTDLPQQPAYAPPLAAHHPEPRLRGSRWMVVAAVALGLVVAAGSWSRSSRVSHVGVFGAGKPAAAETLAAPAAEATPAEPLVPQVEEALPEVDEAVPEVEAEPVTPVVPEEPEADVPDAGDDTYRFSWPDEDGGTWGYEYVVPSDPQTGDGESYRFVWPDEQGSGRDHDLSYRHEGDSYTFEYDGQEYSFDLDDLEWLLGEGDSQGRAQDDAWSLERPGEPSGYGDLQMPGFGDGYPGDRMPGYGSWDGSW